MEFKIDISQDVWDKAKAKLSSSQIASAMRMAINEGLVKGRTEVRRATQEIYNFKASLLNDPKTGLQINKATGKNLTGYISAGHKPVSLKEANPRFKGITIANKVKQGKDGKMKKGGAIKRSVSQISVEVIKGQRKTLQTAFVPGRATHAASGMQFTTQAIFARGQRGKPGFQFSKPRMPIDTMSTVSPGTAVTNNKTVEKYQSAVTSYAQSRFVYHIERAIKEVDGLS